MHAYVVCSFTVRIKMLHQNSCKFSLSLRIMLSFLPFIFFPELIFHNFYIHYYSIPMPSPIISVILFKFLLSVAIRSTAFLLADKWIHPVCLTLILLRNSSQFFLCSCLFVAILLFGYISLHSAILVSNNSFNVLVIILLFQHYFAKFVTYYF